MNKRQVTILWIIAILLTVVLVTLKMTRSNDYEAATKRERGETLLADFSAENASKLTITQGDQSVTLIKSDDTWSVAERDDYPANTGRIYEFLRTLDDVEVTQGIGADPELAPRFGMDPKADPDDLPVETTIYDAAGKQIAHLTFGKNLEATADGANPFGSGGVTGRYVRNHADDSGFYATKEVFPTLQADPKRWLEKDFLQLEKIQSIAVSQSGKPDEIAWTLTRPDEAADFSLEGQSEEEKLDPQAVNPLKNLFASASFQDVIPEADAAGAWDESKRRSATIKTVEGFTYRITFGPKKAPADLDAAASADEYLLTVAVNADIPEKRKAEEGESESDADQKQQAFERRKQELEDKLQSTKALEGITYQVSKFTVNALLKEREDLIQSEDETNASANGQPTINRGNPAPQGPLRATTPPISISPAENAQDE